MADQEVTSQHSAWMRRVSVVARRHLLRWILGASALNAALIALTTMLMQLPGQKDSMITLSILTVIVLLATSIGLPVLGHRVEERRLVAQELDQHHQHINTLLIEGSARHLPQLNQVSNEQLGATATRYTRDKSAPYINRTPDDEHIRALLAVSDPPYPFVLVWGATKAGKSRILAEALRALLPGDTEVLIPANAQALAELTRLGLPFSPQAPGLVYLDDLTAADLEALTPAVLETVTSRAVLAATMTAKRRSQVLASGGEITHIARTALERAVSHELIFRPPTSTEQQQAALLYPQESFRGSIAETLVGGVELIAKYRAGQDTHPAGCALVQAAVDCKRVGLNRPITDSELRRLYAVYLPLIRSGMPATDTIYESGLHQWATVPVASQVSLLSPVPASTMNDQKPGWVVLDHLVSADEGATPSYASRPIPDGLWSELLEVITESDACNVGITAYVRKQTGHAISAWRKVTTSNDPNRASMGAVGLGLLLNEQGDVEGARAAFQQAIDSGHTEHAPAAALSVGGLLRKQGDVEGARAAFQQAIDSGHTDYAPRAAISQGVLLGEQGDVEGARVAYQQAIDSGHTDHALTATFGLGNLLRDQGNMEGAQTAYQRVIDSGHTEYASAAAFNLGELLRKQGDVEGARAAFQQAIDSGHADHALRAAISQGVLLGEQGDVEGARVAYQRVIDSGHTDHAPMAAINKGLLLGEQGDVEVARVAYQQAIDSGHTDHALAAVINLGNLLRDRGDVEGARAAYQRVVASGHTEYAPAAAANEGLLLHDQGDVEGARAAFQQAIDSGHTEHAPRAAIDQGILLGEQGDVEGAQAAFQQAIDSHHIDYALTATFGLGNLLRDRGDVEGARAAYQRVIASGHTEYAPSAAVNEGLLLHDQGDVEGARAAFQRAIDSGNREIKNLALQALWDLPDSVS